MTHTHSCIDYFMWEKSVYWWLIDLSGLAIGCVRIVCRIFIKTYLEKHQSWRKSLTFFSSLTAGTHLPWHAQCVQSDEWKYKCSHCPQRRRSHQTASHQIHASGEEGDTQANIRLGVTLLWPHTCTGQLHPTFAGGSVDGLPGGLVFCLYFVVRPYVNCLKRLWWVREMQKIWTIHMIMYFSGGCSDFHSSGGSYKRYMI